MIVELSVVARLMMMPPAPVPPVMQVDLRPAFADHPMVQKVSRDGRFDEGTLAFLTRASEPLAARLAVAAPQALTDVTQAGDAFARAAFGGLALAAVTDKTDARADLLSIGAYLSASRTGAPTSHARALAEAARRRAPTSFVTAMLAALLAPQTRGQSSPCDTARVLTAPIRDPKLTTDVSDAALFALTDVAFQAEDLCRAETAR